MRFFEHQTVYDKRPGGYYDQSKDDPWFKPLFEYHERRERRRENKEPMKLLNRKVSTRRSILFWPMARFK
jgi:hypothetical protein